MRDRLSARGDSWGEFIRLLAHMRIDTEDKKKKEKAKSQAPILPPPAVLAEWEKRRAQLTKPAETPPEPNG